MEAQIKPEEVKTDRKKKDGEKLIDTGKFLYGSDMNLAQSQWIEAAFKDIATSYDMNPVYKHLGNTHKSLMIEACRFGFKIAPIKWEKYEVTKDEVTKEVYNFIFEYEIPGLRHKLKFEKRIEAKEFDGIL